MRSAFSNLLEKLIDTQFDSRREFVRAADPSIKSDKKKENKAQGYVSKVINGKPPPILERVSLWADVLKLTGAERQRFLDLAAISHLPESVQSQFVGIIDKIALIEARQDAIESRRQRGGK